MVSMSLRHYCLYFFISDYYFKCCLFFFVILLNYFSVISLFFYFFNHSFKIFPHHYFSNVSSHLSFWAVIIAVIVQFFHFYVSRCFRYLAVIFLQLYSRYFAKIIFVFFSVYIYSLFPVVII